MSKLKELFGFAQSRRVVAADKPSFWPEWKKVQGLPVEDRMRKEAQFLAQKAARLKQIKNLEVWTDLNDIRLYIDGILATKINNPDLDDRARYRLVCNREGMRLYFSELEQIITKGEQAEQLM